MPSAASITYNFDYGNIKFSKFSKSFSRPVDGLRLPSFSALCTHTIKLKYSWIHCQTSVKYTNVLDETIPKEKGWSFKAQCFCLMVMDKSYSVKWPNDLPKSKLQILIDCLRTFLIVVWNLHKVSFLFNWSFNPHVFYDHYFSLKIYFWGQVIRIITVVYNLAWYFSVFWYP